MAIYSTNRTYLGSYDVEPNEEYFGEAGCYNAIAENYINDLNLFNAVIATDFEEIALGENAYEIELLQEATGESMIDKLKAFVKKCWEKVKGLFQTFIKKITILMTRDNKELVNKYKKEVYKKDLSKMKYKWCKINNDPGMTGPSAISKLDDLMNTVIKSANADAKDKIEDSDYVDELLSTITKLKSTSMSDFKQDLHEYYFDEEEEEEGLSGDMLSKIVTTLVNSKETLKGINKAQTESDKYFNKVLKNIDALQKEILKNLPDKADTKIGKVDGKDEYSYDSRNITSGTNSKRSYTKIKAKDITHSEFNTRVNLVHTAISKAQTAMNTLIAGEMTEVKFGIAQARKVFGKAVTFNPKSVKESAILAEAYGESLADDMEMFMDSYEH